MNRKAWIIIISFSLILGISIGWLLKESSIPKKEVIEQSNSTPEEEANNYPEFYDSVFKRDGQVFIGKPLSKDLTGDSQPELIFTTVGEGCASCHAQNIYIFQGGKEMIKLELDDPIFYPLPSRGFLIVEPIRKEREGMCCPTSFQNAVYLWDGETFRKK